MSTKTDLLKKLLKNLMTEKYQICVSSKNYHKIYEHEKKVQSQTTVTNYSHKLRSHTRICWILFIEHYSPRFFERDWAVKSPL